LVRTDVTNQSTRTFASAETGTIEAWDWSPDGKTLAYIAGDQLWLKAGNQPAASVASFKKQGGRGGGWDDEIVIRFSPSGTYFVLVHTVTIPNTFQIRRATDGAVVWASPSSDFQAPGFATMPAWSRGVDRLLFRDGNGVRRWDPSGTVTTLVPGLRWYEPSISPDGRTIAYTVLDAQSKPRVELIDLQSLKVQALPSPLRWRPMFASAGLLLYVRAEENGLPGQGVLAYNLTSRLETALPYVALLDVWPS
jgi:Tol biopolymer transport system component